MTEKEIIERQERSGNEELYLILVGSFLHAYGAGAFALARLMGYRVMRKKRKVLGEVLTTGFPMAQIDRVARRISEAGGHAEQLDNKTWRFGGVDTTPVEVVEKEDPPPKDPPPTPPVEEGESLRAGNVAERVTERVRSFNLVQATPLEAMMFLASLKEQLKNRESQ